MYLVHLLYSSSLVLDELTTNWEIDGTNLPYLLIIGAACFTLRSDALADQVISLLSRCKRFIIEAIGGRVSLRAFLPHINIQGKSFGREIKLKR